MPGHTCLCPSACLYHQCVMAAGSLSPETSTILVNSYQSGVGRKLWQLFDVNRILFFIGQAWLASLKGSGSCSGILPIAFVSDSVSWVNLTEAGTSQLHSSGSAYWWMVTGAITVNTSITETSSLFVTIRECPAWTWRTAHGKGLHMAGLLVP